MSQPSPELLEDPVAATPVAEEPGKEKTADVPEQQPKKMSQKKRKPSADTDAGAKTIKKKKLKDENAPKQPLNGYVRFLAKNRERVRDANPGASFPDVTKLLAAEWTKLPQEEKQVYLDEAEKDKERYHQELEEYKRTESFRLFQEKSTKAANKEPDSNAKPEPKTTKTTSKADKTGKEKDKDKENARETNSTDIPIFTEEFLEHNRARESELRQLRKLNTEYEEQNAILSKHIENMKSAVEKFEAESVQYRMNTKALEDHLTALSVLLTQKFAHVPDPVTGEPPRVESIEEYMVRMHQHLLKNSGDKENDISLNEAVQSIVISINPDDIAIEK